MKSGWSKAERLQARIILTLIIIGLISSRLGVGSIGDIRGFALNFGTEMLGAATTYWLLTRILGRELKHEEEERETEALKARLIREMGSNSMDVAVPAARELEAHGWLTDGSLKGVSLFRSNLQESFLFGVNLQEALLFEANLQEAFLWRAKLQGVYLAGANLQGADLRLANLRGAKLEHPNFGKAKFSEDTILPDGTKWTPGTDMARFTDPEHPDFWRSNDPKSPAYRGDETKP